MARTASSMMPLATPMPVFELPDGAGATHASHACTGSAGTLVVFMCNHCPFVVHIADELAAIARDHADAGIALVGINSNDIAEYPADGPAEMLQFQSQHALQFPYLLDDSQAVAKAFGAMCTPDFFLYDRSGMLVYRGQLDDARPGSDVPVTGVDIRSAIAALCSGAPISDDQVPSMGCNIKWKATAS